MPDRKSFIRSIHNKIIGKQERHLARSVFIALSKTPLAHLELLYFLFWWNWVWKLHKVSFRQHNFSARDTNTAQLVHSAPVFVDSVCVERSSSVGQCFKIFEVGRSLDFCTLIWGSEIWSPYKGKFAISKVVSSRWKLWFFIMFVCTSIAFYI